MSSLWADPVYGPLARALYERCGLVFDGGQAQLFRKRLERRAAERGYASPGQYLGELCRRPGDAEWEELVNLLTVNETYFFREEEHFHLLLDRFWPAWARAGSPIRIWSAACSTGCEPYTLAMLLRERGLVGPGRAAVEILGTDVNGRVLEEARAAVYSAFSLRNTPPHYRERYFRKVDQLYHLDPQVRQMVQVRRLNLLRPEDWVAAETFHAVLCRNVLIYFDREAKRRVVDVLTRALRPGGVFLVGRSESLFNVPEAPPMVSMGGIMVHHKPEVVTRAAR